MSFDPSAFDGVSSEQATELFERFSLAEIAEAWCAYQLSKDERYWWAVALMWSDPNFEDRARREKFIEGLIETAPNDDVLAVAAAGPLEDAIYDSDECVDWLQARASTSSRFRKALGMVWIWDDVSPERFERIERLADRPLPRPKNHLDVVEGPDFIAITVNGEEVERIPVDPEFVAELAKRFRISGRIDQPADDGRDGP